LESNLNPSDFFHLFLSKSEKINLIYFLSY
jgi:hypothetical protein